LTFLTMITGWHHVDSLQFDSACVRKTHDSQAC
jgi:hypothetical protein